MKLAQTLSVVYCVIRVVWCMDFSITLPETVEAVNGLCVLVPCQFQIKSDYANSLKETAKGIWYKDGIAYTNIVFNSSIPEDKIKGEITGDLSKKNCTSIFTSISTASSGKYRFRIEGKGLKWTYQESYVSINVKDSPPKPTLSLNVDQQKVNDLKNVMEGSSVNLICSALAPCPFKPPILTWTSFSPNISIQEQTQNTSFISSYLSFTASHLHNGVHITCNSTYQPENQAIKRVSPSCLLRVLYPPRDTAVSVVPPGPVLLGRSVSLICSSDGNPAVNYTWYRENGEQIGTGPNLTIPETNNTHSGLYYCRAQNPHGTHNSSVTLNLRYPPRDTAVSVVPPGPVLFGRAVSLICSSDGNPALLNFTWYRENGEQIGTGDTLTITDTNDTHSGFYYCRAQNPHGTHNSSVTLDIQYPPRNTSAIVVPPGPVLLGNSVSLICSSDGNPAVLNFTWYRENREQIGTGPNLTIHRTARTHSGLYYCRAQNPHGSHNSSVTLDIHFPPQVSLSSHCNSSDGGILCVCEVHGFPVPKLEWRLSQRSVTPSENSSIKEEPVGSAGLKSFFTISPSATDTPTLQCIGSNNLGSTSQQFYPVVSNFCFPPVFSQMSSMLVGAVVGASAVMLLWIIYVCGRRKHHKPSQEESSGLVLNERIPQVVNLDEEEESLYTNKSFKRAPNPRDPDILHYSTISFPDGEDRSGEIRGLSSLTSEYATVQHSHGEQGEKEITAAEIQPPSEEEGTYGNIIRHKTSHSDVDADVTLEQPETRKTEPERSTHSEEAEDLYAEVKHKEHKEKAKKKKKDCRNIK